MIVITMVILVDPGPPRKWKGTSHVGLSVYNSSTSSVSTLTFNRTNQVLNKKLETFSVCDYKNGDRMLKHRDHRHPQFRNSGGRQGIQAKCARNRECSKPPIEVQRERKQNLGMFQVYTMFQKRPRMKKRW